MPCMIGNTWLNYIKQHIGMHWQKVHSLSSLNKFTNFGPLYPEICKQKKQIQWNPPTLDQLYVKPLTYLLVIRQMGLVSRIFNLIVFICLRHGSIIKVSVVLVIAVRDPLVISGFPPHRFNQVEIWCSICCWPEQSIVITAELSFISDGAVVLMWRHSNCIYFKFTKWWKWCIGVWLALHTLSMLCRIYEEKREYFKRCLGLNKCHEM